MIGGVTRQGRLPGLPDRVTLSFGVKFCQVNVSMWGNPPTRSRIRDTSNSRKIHFGGDFKSINRQNTCFASIFLVYVLSDHSIISKKVHLWMAGL